MNAGGSAIPSKSKSVTLSDEAARKSKELFERHFGKGE
jgi:hypothetical protein